MLWQKLKIQIKNYFEEHHGKEIDYVDLVQAFPDIPLPVIVEVCEELEKKEKIKESRTR